eukprot:Filipodium_phascolosomae@DN2594_c0_g1_i1.p1
MASEGGATGGMINNQPNLVHPNDSADTRKGTAMTRGRNTSTCNHSSTAFSSDGSRRSSSSRLKTVKLESCSIPSTSHQFARINTPQLNTPSMAAGWFPSGTSTSLVGTNECAVHSIKHHHPRSENSTAFEALSPASRARLPLFSCNGGSRRANESSYACAYCGCSCRGPTLRLHTTDSGGSLESKATNDLLSDDLTRCVSRYLEYPSLLRSLNKASAHSLNPLWCRMHTLHNARISSYYSFCYLNMPSTIAYADALMHTMSWSRWCPLNFFLRTWCGYDFAFNDKMLLGSINQVEAIRLLVGQMPQSIFQFLHFACSLICWTRACENPPDETLQMAGKGPIYGYRDKKDAIHLVFSVTKDTPFPGAITIPLPSRINSDAACPESSTSATEVAEGNNGPQVSSYSPSVNRASNDLNGAKQNQEADLNDPFVFLKQADLPITSPFGFVYRRFGWFFEPPCFSEYMTFATVLASLHATAHVYMQELRGLHLEVPMPFEKVFDILHSLEFYKLCFTSTGITLSAVLRCVSRATAKTSQL